MAMILYVTSIQNISNYHKSIKFLLDYYSIGILLLDVSLRITNNKISTSPFTKPTDSDCYLNSDSYHPTHLKKSIICRLIYIYIYRIAH